MINKELILEKLAKEDLQVLILAYVYAKNLYMYGEDSGYMQARFDYEQQPKGKWIEKWCEWQQYIECSECGYETGIRCNTKFCPNCGADMRGDCE
jgi:hypothetical protein